MKRSIDQTLPSCSSTATLFGTQNDCLAPASRSIEQQSTHAACDEASPSFQIQTPCSVDFKDGEPPIKKEKEALDANNGAIPKEKPDELKFLRPHVDVKNGIYNCNICKIRCYNGKSFREHLLGKKHKKNMSKHNLPQISGDPCNLSHPKPESSAAHIAGSVNKKVSRVETLKKKELKTSTEMKEPKMDALNYRKELVFWCHSIRIGSYQTHSSDGQNRLPVMLTSEGLRFRVPVVKGGLCAVGLQPCFCDYTFNCQAYSYEDQIDIRKSDTVQVLGNFGSCLKILFVFPSSACGDRIRKQLHMVPGDHRYLDPDGDDDCQKIITFLIDTISDDAKSCIIRKLIPKEISEKVAFEILAGSTPQNAPLPTFIEQVNPATPSTVKEIVTYPPPPQTDRITVTSEDMACLQKRVCLNDVIVDFYLKYLMNEKLTETDRNRTHVFSSFFYPRLTQKSYKSRGGKEGMNTKAVQRHTQVRKWTKNTDIFEKDFIIIPINQDGHWILAIICFPGLVPETSSAVTPIRNCSKSSDCVTFTSANGRETCKNPESSQLSDGQTEKEPGKSTSDQTYCTEDKNSDDGRSSDDDTDSSFTNDSDPTTTDSSTQTEDAHVDKMPCILIFDSLCGPNHARVIHILREYLEMEWKMKKNTVRSFSRTSITGHVISVPQQANCSDGGIYILQYVESFFEDPFPYFAHCMPDQKEWFPYEKVMNKRVEIWRLIFELRNQQLSSMANQAGPTENENKTSAAPSTPQPRVRRCKSV